MLRLAADENLNNDIVRGLFRRIPGVDLVTVRDAGLSGASDPAILDWSAGEGRILITHDVSTITAYAYERIRAEKQMPGVFEIRRNFSIRVVIEDLVLLTECSLEGEWGGRILHLPLR